MVMFVLHADGTDFFNFNIPQQTFKVGAIIDNNRLNGKYKVVHYDRVTVTVKPIE
jgi:hypothetical protein